MGRKPLQGGRLIGGHDNMQIELSVLQAELKLMPISLLKPHEEVDLKVLNDLIESINGDRLIKRAIVIDRKTRVIIDGHHRVKALEALNCDKVPCLLIDYYSPKVLVFSWKDGSLLSKNLIIKAGLTGRLLPPKTSKHMLLLDGHMIHISAVEPEVNIPLSTLKVESLPPGNSGQTIM
jgi:hypothetical protein